MKKSIFITALAMAISATAFAQDKTDGKYIVIPDRTEAIRYCIENAKDGDIIVLAGKGHEDYQDKMGVKTHYDEREVIKEIIGGAVND